MLGNLVLEMCNAPGTAADCNLLGPTSGRLPFGFWFPSGSQCFYVLSDGTQSEWGIGTYTAGSPNKLNRTTVLKNSANSTARLNFLGSTKVYNETPAEREIWIDNNGNLVINGQVTSQGMTLSKAGGATLVLNDPSATSNLKAWDFRSAAGNLEGRSVNDTGTTTDAWLTVWRTSGTAILGISLKVDAAGGAINLQGPVFATSSLSVANGLTVTGAASATGNVTALGFLSQVTTAAASPAYVMKNTAGPADQKSSNVYQDASGNISWQFVNDAGNLGSSFFNVSRSGITPQAMTLTAPNVYVNGQVRVTGDVYASNKFQINQGGFYIFQDVANTLTQIIMDGALWRWEWARQGGRLSWKRGSDGQEFFVVDGSGNASVYGMLTVGGRVRATPGDNGFQAAAANSYLTINGSNDFNTGANFIVNGGGRPNYAFEWYWGTDNIGRMSIDGTMRFDSSVYISTATGAGEEFRLFGDGVSRVMRFQSDGWQWQWNNNGTVIYAGSDGVKFYCDGVGNIQAAGAINGTNISDERTKRDVEPYTRGLDDLIQLRPVRFRFNGLGGTQDDGMEKVGLVAQQARPHVPECVHPTVGMLADPRVGWKDKRLPDQLSLDDKPLLFAVINALREINDRLNDTTEKLGIANKRIVQLESRLAA